MSAKQNLSLPRSRHHANLCQLFGFVLLLLPWQLRADSLEDAAHELAIKVCLSAHKQPVKVAWQEFSSTNAYLSDSRRKSFLDQISACGLEPTDASDAPVLTVTLRFTPSEILLIAHSSEVVNGPQIYMVEVPRTALLVARETSPAPQLRGELLLRLEKPIQSAIGWQDPATQERFLLLLSDGQVSRFRFENGDWKWMDSAEPQGAAGRRSRSGDGSLFYNHSKERIELGLRKKTCDLSLNSHLSLTCGGNEAGGRPAEVLTTCEEIPRFLTTGKGDFTQPDQIFLGKAAGANVAGSAGESLSGSVDMPGPVLDLSVGDNSKTAFAVVKNLLTGNYEVYRITAVCTN